MQLNKTAAFNVEKLLAYNKNPVPMDEMGMKLYYKHDEFLRRKIRKRKNNRLSMLAAEEAGALVAKNALESAPSLRCRFGTSFTYSRYRTHFSPWRNEFRRGL